MVKRTDKRDSRHIFVCEAQLRSLESLASGPNKNRLVKANADVRRKKQRKAAGSGNHYQGLPQLLEITQKPEVGIVRPRQGCCRFPLSVSGRRQFAVPAVFRECRLAFRIDEARHEDLPRVRIPSRLPQ